MRATSPQVAAAETWRACEPHGSEAVLENTEARIYFVHKGTAYRAYACSNRRRNPRHHLLARWRRCECTAPEDFEPQVWLAGEVVAWNQVYCDANGESCTGYTTSMRVTLGRPLQDGRHRADHGALRAKAERFVRLPALRSQRPQHPG